MPLRAVERRAEYILLPTKHRDAVWLVRAHGSLDSADHPVLDLITRPPLHCGWALVDLSEVGLLSARAVGRLQEDAQSHRLNGCETVLVAPRIAAAARVLDACRTGMAATVFESLGEAVRYCTAQAENKPDAADGEAETGAPGEGDECARLRECVRDLHGQLRSRPLIAQAQGVLQGRYGLPPRSDTFGLLRDVSQRHNLRMRVLAEALITARPPDHGEDVWFPGRRTQPPPKMPRTGVSALGNRTTVVRGVIDVACELTAASAACVRLPDLVAGGLRIEVHHGYSDALVDLMERSPHEPSDAELAADRIATVTVLDAALDPRHGQEMRRAMAGFGRHFGHHVPMCAAGAVRGVLSVHRERPGAVLTHAEARDLDRIADETATWLAWHHRTVVLDALEELHGRARAAGGRAAGITRTPSGYPGGAGGVPARPT